jgi:hypothetical protein
MWEGSARDFQEGAVYIAEVPKSNLGRVTGFPIRIFCWFSPSLGMNEHIRNIPLELKMISCNGKENIYK